MSATQYINAAEFMQHLKENNLYIVHGDELAQNRLAEQREKQRRLMKKLAISFADAIAAGFFPVKTSQGLRHWNKQGKFLKGEVYKAKNGHWMIMASAIKRLGYAE